MIFKDKKHFIFYFYIIQYFRIIHGMNDFAEVSKNLTKSEDNFGPSE